jgi:uncharacterized protein (DUF58 family)
MVSAQRVVIFLFLLSLLAGAMTGAPLFYRLSYLWALLLIGSWVMSAVALRGVRLHREARALRSQVGQIFEERYEIQNTGRAPRLWIEVRDESTLPGSHGSHVLTLIGGRESRSYLARTRLTERGVFPLGPTELISGDLLSSTHLVSCRQTTSGSAALSQPSRCGIRALMEFTFQVAIFIRRNLQCEIRRDDF